MLNQIRVVKYGGSSLATIEDIEFVASQIIERKQAGERIVVVASAMGDTTDRLMTLAGEISGSPPVRELDKLLSTGENASTALLSMALQRLGHDAVSLTGAQSGVRTSGDHFNAAVENVDTGRIDRELDRGRIVVAAGFQGENAAREVTTLGLGGSDTTAVVLAAALNARECVICSDVDGVYSADPRVVEHARRIDELSFDEMIEMARHGASVLNPSAVAHARDHGVGIRCCSTRDPNAPGTLIHDIDPDRPRVVGIASHGELLPLRVDAAGTEIASSSPQDFLNELDDDDVFHDRVEAGTGHRHVLIPAERLPDAASFADEVETRYGQEVRVGPRCSSVSAVGLGVGAADHIRNTSRRYSEKAGIALRGEFAGEHSVTCVVRPEQAARLMNVFHREFECPATEAA